MIRETARGPGSCAGSRNSGREAAFYRGSGFAFVKTAPKAKKCAIYRANIVHFVAFKLHQNVSYKMCLENTPNALEFGKQTPVMPKKWG